MELLATNKRVPTMVINALSEPTLRIHVFDEEFFRPEWKAGNLDIQDINVSHLFAPMIFVEACDIIIVKKGNLCKVIKHRNGPVGEIFHLECFYGYVNDLIDMYRKARNAQKSETSSVLHDGGH